jgi:hypothetical protein
MVLMILCKINLLKLYEYKRHHIHTNNFYNSVKLTQASI